MPGIGCGCSHSRGPAFLLAHHFRLSTGHDRASPLAESVAAPHPAPRPSRLSLMGRWGSSRRRDQGACQRPTSKGHDAAGASDVRSVRPGVIAMCFPGEGSIPSTSPSTPRPLVPHRLRGTRPKPGASFPRGGPDDRPRKRALNREVLPPVPSPPHGRLHTRSLPRRPTRAAARPILRLRSCRARVR